MCDSTQWIVTAGGRTDNKMCFFAMSRDINSVEKNNKSGQVTVNYYYTLGSYFQRKYCYVSQELLCRKENNYTSHVSACVCLYELRRRKLWDISVRDRHKHHIMYLRQRRFDRGKLWANRWQGNGHLHYESVIISVWIPQTTAYTVVLRVFFVYTQPCASYHIIYYRGIAGMMLYIIRASPLHRDRAIKKTIIKYEI